MSSRSKKTVTKTTSSTSTSASTPMSGTSRSPGRNRPPSPTMISRMEEKNILAELNNRLAAYIDKVRSLEAENLRLSTQIRSQEETVHRETSNIKALYEKELADARKLLDDTANDKARIQIELDRQEAQALEWKEKFLKADRELSSAQKKLLAAEGHVNDLQARLSDAVNQRKHWESEYNKAKAELLNLQRMLEDAQKKLEEETMRRVEFENRVQSLKEELAFKSQIHEQELNETRTRTETSVVEEVDGVRVDYENKLADALRQMREDAETTIRVTREETEENFISRLDQLRGLAERGDRHAMATREELRTCRRRIDDLTSELEGLKTQSAMFQSRIRDLEAQLVREGEEHERQLGLKDEEIHSLRQSLAEQLTEYRELMDIKIALDMEIAAYRKLLESEEVRLNISSMESPAGTPMRSSYSGRKRKRLDIESQSQQGFVVTSTKNGPIIISETDEGGKFIKLFNESDKDVALGSWQLKHAAGDQETIFKFHRSLHVKPGASVTVWSTDAEATHSPPTDIVMKNQKWFTSDNMTTTLVSNQGEDMCAQKMDRTPMTTRITSSSSEGSEAHGYRSYREHSERWGDPQRDEKCSIM